MGGFWSWLLGGADTVGRARSPRTIPSQLLDDKDLDCIELPGPGTYLGEVVRESLYQDALNAICGGKSESGHHKIVKALLVCEDSNPHDTDAVRVDIDGKTVGYLNRLNARHFRKQLIAGGCAGMPGLCSAEIVGGWDRGGGDEGNYEVKLDLRVAPLTR